LLDTFLDNVRKWEKVVTSGLYMNFRGRSLRNLDPKGRLMLSPEYRESLYLRMDTDNSKSENLTHAQNTEQKIIDTNAVHAIIEKENSQEIKFVITTYDNCLAAFPWSDWLKLEEQFARLPNPSSRLRSFRRLFIGGAEEQIVDPQGRVRLSLDHKEYAKLEKEVTILGLITRFEIWNSKLLRASIEAQSLDDVTEELSASGIDFAL